MKMQIILKNSDQVFCSTFRHLDYEAGIEVNITSQFVRQRNSCFRQFTVIFSFSLQLMTVAVNRPLSCSKNDVLHRNDKTDIQGIFQDTSKTRL